MSTYTETTLAAMLTPAEQALYHEHREEWRRHLPAGAPADPFLDAQIHATALGAVLAQRAAALALQTFLLVAQDPAKLPLYLRLAAAAARAQDTAQKNREKLQRLWPKPVPAAAAAPKPASAPAPVPTFTPSHVPAPAPAPVPTFTPSHVPTPAPAPAPVSVHAPAPNTTPCPADTPAAAAPAALATPSSPSSPSSPSIPSIPPTPPPPPSPQAFLRGTANTPDIVSGLLKPPRIFDPRTKTYRPLLRKGLNLSRPQR